MTFTLFWLAVLTFSIWMLIDCLSNKVKDKIFWSIVILLTPPIGAIIYIVKRPTLIDGASTNDKNVPANSSTSQVIRGLGMALGVIITVSGFLLVGFFILCAIALSSMSSSK